MMVYKIGANKNFNIRLNKCKNSGFYLGLVRNCEWIDELKQNIVLKNP